MKINCEGSVCIRMRKYLPWGWANTDTIKKCICEIDRPCVRRWICGCLFAKVVSTSSSMSWPGLPLFILQILHFDNWTKIQILCLRFMPIFPLRQMKWKMENHSGQMRLENLFSDWSTIDLWPAQRMFKEAQTHTCRRPYVDTDTERYLRPCFGTFFPRNSQAFPDRSRWLCCSSCLPMPPMPPISSYFILVFCAATWPSSQLVFTLFYLCRCPCPCRWASGHIIFYIAGSGAASGLIREPQIQIHT